MIRIPEVAIRILIPECVFESEEVNFGLAIRIPDKAIRIQIPECVFGSEKVNFGQEIQIPDEAIQILDEAIRIQIPECVSRSEKVNFGQAIRIPDVAIWIPIPESFLNSKKVKNGLAIRIPKGAIRILCVKAADKSWICTPKKKCIFLHDPNVFWIWLFLRWLFLDRFKVIYDFKIWSKEADRFLSPKSYRKHKLKSDSNHL